MTISYRRLWDAHAPIYRLLCAALAPAAWAYGAAVAVRSWAYDTGLLKSTAAPLPSLCVGNLTVGGTGKTPLAAWFAGELRRRGLSPAIVMRGYGQDEPTVHRVLNPSVPVYVAPDRVAGVRGAAEAGQDVAVLDDAFQHRRIRPQENVAIIAAEDWHPRRHLLPRGPWREPLSGLRRATLAVVSRKSASAERAAEIEAELRSAAPEVPTARVHLALSRLYPYHGAEERLGPAVPLAGFRCGVAVAGVARPESFWAQLEAAAVAVDERRVFPDHHRYSRDEAQALEQAAGGEPILASLKDAVKLRPLLAPESELYVPLQEPVWEASAQEIEAMLERIQAACTAPGERRKT
ncbi:MAG: tetraacyldisaccharide 4'-kinase [Gemmatimonadetes bacterium]|uniref:Tetraacyldisaccharide 4'-kinase n=1 Tax=Candidatus Kutchimonas denitrificans TaxID=3056748 RepID=A0AAE4Z9Z5_9BACT|nr:tetraacyldisaccharide 4'-kinase [Gemmatimonadota bacterium]NIR75277.1 tetraacyldisaccharide 4'-kinase [Candidatus Kutchimonas denitrificans]NIS00215.1 tetraacyldisaccharide 4'-kinase [Gemmatimonadota bacterium]NIT65807.1 tetraacyldisaccharide 4'-kinase [Gemmatimonadota bacterium]NIU53085.1 hypothetical protein [Gemmatimonadota bacterium]